MMKRLKRISLLVVLFLIILIGSVFAAEGKVEIVKDFEKIEPGKTGTVQLKLTSADKAVVGIQMAVKGSENIEITGVASASEKWNLTAYNPDNGLAILTNTDGAQSGNIVKITFKVRDNAKDEGSISVENFEVSSIEYDYVTIANVSTKILIESKTEEDQPQQPQEPEKPQQPQEPEQPKQEEPKPEEKPQEQPKQEEKPSNKPTNTQKPSNTNNKVDNTVAGGKIPHTGKSTTIILAIAIVAIIGTVCYIKYKRID